jgi:hypothetical protein
MKILLYTLFLIGIFKTAGAQVYSADQIPKDLMPYASAVVRNNETTIEIKDKDNVVYHVKLAVTILNSNGASDGAVALWYKKGTQIKSFKGFIYDEYGKQTAKLGESDLKDSYAAQDFSLFEDIRLKYYTPSNTVYPYTVAYEYEIRTNQSLNISTWMPTGRAAMAVEHSACTLICKPDYAVRYKETNYPGQAQITDNKGLKNYNWQIDHVKARHEEPYSPNLESVVTSVRFAPQNFSYEDISGSYSNWQNLGKWYYDNLLTGRTSLPAETVQQMKDLTAGITDPKEKARKIYEYMQHKTRYVSIQIGIGGYQPFQASEVDQLGYGDCKGLVNYTQALLKAVNIDSYFCVVMAGDQKVNFLSDFAGMNQGNHAILCLPFAKDTTWLECTSKSTPFGFLGTFTDDRLVLANTPEGGKLMRTTKYTTEDNKESRKADFVITEDGKISGSMLTTFACVQFQTREGFPSDFADQVKRVKNVYPINEMNVEDYKLRHNRKPKPVIAENIKFNAPNYASTDNGQLKFMVNPINRIKATPREVRNRNNPLYINRGYSYEDVINYTVPPGYHPDKTLLNVNLQKPFGSYTASVTVVDNQLIYTRKFKLVDGTYSKDAYSDFVDFYEAIVDADNYSITMVKNK